MPNGLAIPGAAKLLCVVTVLVYGETNLVSRATSLVYSSANLVCRTSAVVAGSTNLVNRVTSLVETYALLMCSIDIVAATLWDEIDIESDGWSCVDVPSYVTPREG